MWLKQSTAITAKIGPFIDDTDGKTAETGLTIAQADVRLSKNGGDIAQKNEATSCTHDELGIYGCPIDTTDTATLGRLQLWVHKSGALPVWHEFMVVPANVWDSMFGSDMLKVDVHAIDDDETAADNLESYCDGTTPQPVNATQISSDATAADNLELITEIANITSLTVDASGHLECDVVEIEGADPTDTIRDAVVDDATRIDASALNTLSGHDPGGTLCADGTPLTAAETESEVNDALVALKLDHLVAVADGDDPVDNSIVAKLAASDGDWSGFSAAADSLEALRDRGDAAWVTAPNDLSAAEVNAEVDTALADIHLDHLLAADYDPTSKPGTATALLNELVENDGGVSRFTQNALEQGPATTTSLTLHSDYDAAKTAAPANEYDTEMARITGNVALASGVNCTQVEGGDATDAIQTAADAALVANHLDHLLKTAYDPAAKPGAVDALLNELIESDAGVSRYTANALEEAPTGGSAPTVGEIADAVWDEDIVAAHNTADTAGALLDDVGTPADFKATGFSTHSAADAADQVWDEAQSGHVGVGSFGEEVQSHATPAEVDAECDEALTNYDAPTKAEMDTGFAALNDLSAAQVNTEVDAALTDYDAPTKAEMDTAFTALNDIAVIDITQRQIPDSVPADGTRPTIEQALYMITQFLYERAVAGTTVTVKKVDGSTSLLTLTLDDGTDPTSITRAS